MKKTSKSRLILDRETVKALVVELSTDQLRYVEGGILRNGSNFECGSSRPECGCPTIISTDSLRC